MTNIKIHINLNDRNINTQSYFQYWHIDAIKKRVNIRINCYVNFQNLERAIMNYKSIYSTKNFL